jgi:hypothetical protein
MNCTIIYGGFNPAWDAGRLERQLVNSLSETLNKSYPNLKKVIAVTSWHEPAELVKQINEIGPDLTFLCSLTDPLGPIESLADQIPGQVRLIGYVDSEYFLDFWAIACSKLFRKYTVDKLEPVQFDNLFLNYNRKPHRHRTELVKLFEESNLIDYGCVTLGNSNYTVGDKVEQYIAYGANDIVGDVGIPNDIYSLGQLKIWNTSFINVVSETQYEYSRNVFLSEKTFKPIIGLRPFVINGSPGIYRILKQAGFDCFEDLFPVDLLSNENFNYTWKFDNHKHIVESLNNLKDKNLTELYHQIKPRLLYNQAHFYEYARNQAFNRQFKI